MRGRGSPGGDEFIREVDEAVRQERWLKLWKQYGAYAIGAALAIVIGSAAGVGWRHYQDSQRQDEARRFAAAERLLEQDRAGEAAEAFARLAQDASSGYRVVARLRAAEAEAEAGAADKAADILAGLAADDDAAPVYRKLGELLAVQRAFDATPPDRLTDQLAGLTEDASPWRHSALELKALAQLKAGDREAARRTLEQLLGDPRTPPNLGRRAAELLAALGGPVETAANATPDDQ